MRRGSPGKKWKSAAMDGDDLREVRLEALYEVAARVFHEFGFRGASLERIAERLGVSKPTLYHYVSGKGDLFYRLHDIALARAEGHLAQALAQGGSGLDSIERAIGSYIRDMARSPLALMIVEEGALSEEQTRDIIRRRRALDQSLRDMVTTGIKDGSIAPCDPKAVALTVLGAVNWMSRWYKRDGAWTEEQVVQAILAPLLRGIAAHPETRPLPQALD